MIWTQVFNGREVMARILATIGTKQALRARFHLRYVLCAAMAGVICDLMYLFAYQLKTELGQAVGRLSGRHFRFFAFKQGRTL